MEDSLLLFQIKWKKKKKPRRMRQGRCKKMMLTPQEAWRSQTVAPAPSPYVEGPPPTALPVPQNVAMQVCGARAFKAWLQ